jgi:hypothetical protein
MFARLPAFAQKLFLVFVVVSFLRIMGSFANTNNQNRYSWLDWSGFYVTFELRDLDTATCTLHSNLSGSPCEGSGCGIFLVNQN